jgi:glycosyltransferase involved in cell wall biosynthesis
VRVIALLATYNEHRVIEPCLKHLHEQGIDTYLLDNGSTDNTVELAERHFGRGLIGLEAFPRQDDVFNLRSQLIRKEELARELDADWFIHLDPDEIRLPPSSKETLREALEVADHEQFNAVNFIEFTFIPTREEPDHDHSQYQQTLRTYYPFSPRWPHQLKAWKANPDVDLANSGGHRVNFPDLRMYPRSFPVRHYLFLSVAHACEKYAERHFDPDEVKSGWHGWRASLGGADLSLPSKSDLRVTRSDEDLDFSEPRKKHYLEEPWGRP